MAKDDEAPAELESTQVRIFYILSSLFAQLSTRSVTGCPCSLCSCCVTATAVSRPKTAPAAIRLSSAHAEWQPTYVAVNAVTHQSRRVATCSISHLRGLGRTCA